MIQTLDYKYPSFCFEDADNFEKKIEKQDINFDGNDDILVYLGQYGNQGVKYYHCFLWNDKHQRFINYDFFSNIQNPIIDSENKMIYSSSRNNTAHYEYEVFKWNENNKLISLYKVHKIYSAMEIADIYDLEVPSDMDSGEFALQYFGLDSKLYDEIFYIKEIDDKNAMKLIKPSMILFSDISSNLCDIIK